MYEYIDDKDILVACSKLGLTEGDVGIVRLKQKDLAHVRAVGTNGNRSIMFSVALALLLQGAISPDDFIKDAENLDRETANSFLALARQLRGDSKPSKQRYATDNGGSGYGWQEKSSSGKRKWDNGDDYEDYGDYYGSARDGWKSWSYSGAQTKKRNAGKQSKQVPNEKSLDKQLEEYMGDSD